MLSKHEEQEERRQVLENDKALRGASSQGSTFAQFAASEVGTPLGRFSAISNPVVVGSEPIPKYPAAFLQHDPVPTEPPLGVDINAMEPVGQPHELKASISSLGPPDLAEAQEPPTLDAPPKERTPLAGDVARRGRTSSSHKSFRRF
jgi:hypothetical protein